MAKSLEGFRFGAPESKARPYQKEVFIHVNSARRISPSQFTSGGPFTVNLSDQADDIIAVDMSEVRIPKTFYNITAANNNIDINDGAPKTATVAPGGYGITSLVAAVQTALNAVSAGWTVTYNPQQFTVTIANAGSFSVLFGTGPNANASLAIPLGFTKTDLTGATSYTGPNAIALQTPGSIFIVVSEIGATAMTSSSLASWSWKVLMASANAGAEVVQTVNAAYENALKMHKRNLRSLTVTLTDDGGNVINLNGADWEMTLKAYCA